MRSSQIRIHKQFTDLLNPSEIQTDRSYGALNEMSPTVLHTLELIISCLLVLREMWSYWRKCGTGGEFCSFFLLPARGSGYKLLALEFQLPCLCSAIVDSYPSGTTHQNKHFLVQNALFTVIKLINTGVIPSELGIVVESDLTEACQPSLFWYWHWGLIPAWMHSTTVLYILYTQTFLSCLLTLHL